MIAEASFIGIIVIVIIGAGYFIIRKNAYYKSEEYLSILNQIDDFFFDIDKFKKGYFTNTKKNFILYKYKYLKDCCEKKQKFKNEYIKKSQMLIDIYDDLESIIKEWNNEYIQSELSIVCENVMCKCLFLFILIYKHTHPPW